MSDVPSRLGESTELESRDVLFLKSRHISDEDCASLASHLQKNKALLYMGYNDFGDDGAKKLCEALSSIEGLALRSHLFRALAFRACYAVSAELWTQNLSVRWQSGAAGVATLPSGGWRRASCG